MSWPDAYLALSEYGAQSLEQRVFGFLEALLQGIRAGNFPSKYVRKD